MVEGHHNMKTVLEGHSIRETENHCVKEMIIYSGKDKRRLTVSTWVSVLTSEML